MFDVLIPFQTNMLSDGGSCYQLPAAETKPVGETDPAHVVPNKMAENVSFATPQVPLEISTGNPAHLWEKWKQKFEI